MDGATDSAEAKFLTPALSDRWAPHGPQCPRRGSRRLALLQPLLSLPGSHCAAETAPLRRTIPVPFVSHCPSAWQWSPPPAKGGTVAPQMGAIHFKKGKKKMKSISKVVLKSTGLLLSSSNRVNRLPSGRPGAFVSVNENNPIIGNRNR